MNPRYVWPAVALALGTLAAVVVLSIRHADTAIILAAPLAVVVVPLLGALIGQISAVKDQTNGTTSRLLDALDEAHRLLAAAHVPASAQRPTPGPAQEAPPATGESPGPPAAAAAAGPVG